MPNVNPKIQRHAFTMRVDDDFERRLESLRRRLDPIPSKSDAVRIAVDIALEKDDAAKTIARLERRIKALEDAARAVAWFDWSPCDDDARKAIDELREMTT